MRLAIEEAKKGEGFVNPNPLEAEQSQKNTINPIKTI